MNKPVEDIRFHYDELLPPDRIAHLVFCFFQFVISGGFPGPIAHEVFPDGCISLMCRRNSRLDLNLLLLKGLSLDTFHTEVFTDDVLWGVKLSPAACEKILRCDPKYIPTQPVFENELLGHLTSQLSHKLKECETFADAASVFEEVLRKLEIEEKHIDKKTTEAIRLIEGSKGEMRISEIAELVNLSTRQLERRFRKSSGLTPKQFSRICRLRATAINLIEKDMNWANRAAELGFTDQAHLTRELSLLTGRSPKSFERLIEEVDYKNLVK